MLHITKVAFGCTSFADLSERIASRAPGPMRMTTRYKPKRHAEIVGGSLFWILKHQLIGRSEITAFEEREDGKTDILLEPRLVAVRPVPRRAHQGWRYLETSDAPADLGEGEATGDPLPPELIGKLAELGLL